jgi:GPH family glycoside/pentoside/hexuronide:cation symporter
MTDPKDPMPATPGPNPARLSLGRLIAYALPAAPSSAVDTPISVYLPAFYASAAGLSLSLVGALILAARIAEIPITLAAGGVSDRWGPPRRRRRFWLIAATPMALIGIWRLFDPPPQPGGAYLLGWLLTVIVGGTFIYLNHIAWGAEASAGYDERTRVQAARQVASVAGLVLVLVPPILIEHAHPPDLERLRMLAIAGFFLLLLPLAVACAVLIAPERPTPIAQSERPSLRAALAALAGDRALRRLLLIDLCDAVSIGVVTSLFVFVARDAWRLGGVTSLLLLSYLLCGLVALAPILKLARGRRKSRTVAWIALYISAALPVLLLVPPGGAAVAFAGVILLGAPSATNTALLDSMMADIAAADAARHGASRAALFYALHMVVGRIGRGLAVGIGFALLDVIGFHPHAANAPSALMDLRLIYLAGPLLTQLAIAGLMWSFPEPRTEPV